MCRWIAVLLIAGSAFAEDKIVSTRIFTEPLGASFTVDGQTYVGSATFLWPERSKHVLGIPDVNTNNLVMFGFKEWQDASGQKLLAGSTVTIIADSAIPYYKSIWKAYYAIDLMISAPDTATFSCETGTTAGRIYMNAPATDSCYYSSQRVWGEAGNTIQVQAVPPPGFVFFGWIGNLNGLQSPILSFTLNTPVMIYARFGPATPVSFTTVPAGLKVIADRQIVKAPISYDWAEGSQHALGVVSPQLADQGGWLVFDSWSDGGTQNHSYTTGPPNVAVTLTARFVPGVSVGVVSNPIGLKLTVDGLTAEQPNFVWGLGSKHTISAPAELADAGGRRYRFRSWAHGGDATQEVTVDASSTGWIANYDPLNALNVTTNPPGLTLTVDGASCTSPCTVYRDAGAEVKVAAPSSVTLQESARIDFESWTDGGPLSHTVKADADRKTVQAAYQYSYRIATASDPAGGADFRFEPPSPDGFFPSGTQVAVIARARAGYRFRLWRGDLSGGLTSGFLKVSSPRSVTAVLDQVPYVAPSGVRNAAAVTPESGVAPGSIIAIYGSSLAGGELAGPQSPLAQTLGGVTVRLLDRLLGLFFVSPEQINAQLPSDLAPGDYTLRVRWEGHEEVSASFRIVRNAPGLFTQPAGGVAWALATRADGKLIAPDAPAAPGDTITLYGTGFGGYLGIAPDGFAVPDSMTLPLADPVEVLIAGQRIAPEFAGAAGGSIGVAIIRFRIPDTATEPGIDLRVTANAVESNTIVVPVRKKSTDSETGPG